MEIWIFPPLAFVWPSKIFLAFFQFSWPSDILNIELFWSNFAIKTILLKIWQSGSVCWLVGTKNTSWVGSYVKFINFLGIYNHSKFFDSFDYSVKQLCIFLNHVSSYLLKFWLFIIHLSLFVCQCTGKSFSAWYFFLGHSNIWQKIVNKTDQSYVNILSRDFHEPITNKFGLMENSL